MLEALLSDVFMTHILLNIVVGAGYRTWTGTTKGQRILHTPTIFIAHDYHDLWSGTSYNHILNLNSKT